MMPSPKMAILCRPPPVNRFRKLNRPLPLSWFARLEMLTPGAGIQQPMRYRAMMKKGNRIFFLKSGILNASRNPENSLKLDHLCLAARAFDRLPRAPGEGVRLHGEALLQLAVTEYLDVLALLLDEAAGRQRRRVDHGGFVEPLLEI